MTGQGDFLGFDIFRKHMAPANSPSSHNRRPANGNNIQQGIQAKCDRTGLHSSGQDHNIHLRASWLHSCIEQDSEQNAEDFQTETPS